MAWPRTQEAAMAQTLKLPLSGDVSQFIAPWSWFIRQAGQVGLINIDVGDTPAPDVETTVLSDVGTYGRQIGRLADAMEVLIACLDRNSLSPDQQAAISAFETQWDQVREIKIRQGRGAQPELREPAPRFRKAD